MSGAHRTKGRGVVGGGLEIRELECFLVVAEELHFGRASERLYVSQSRVSQLIAALERRVGARLVERTSRRVALTPLGVDFRAALVPAYGALRAAVEEARAAAGGMAGRLRIGFQAPWVGALMETVTDFQDRFPEVEVELAELPLSDPFGAVRRGEVDTAVVMLPVLEKDLVLGPVFSRQWHRLALSVRHPLAGVGAAGKLTAEDLATVPLISAAGPAPEYWREVQAPTRTPGGRPVPRGPVVRTLQEGLSLTAAGRGGMLLCGTTGDYHRRDDIVYLPVGDLPASALGLVWRRDHETARIREFARGLAERAGRARRVEGVERMAG
ncbi:LysR family transcriptional regulator [Streptomyces carpaticus]|uniref:LysR family transcriptional regulator n=1 Tax=Streptomyces carpaticus TaxID=285558 RepID=UPI0031F9F960